MPKKGRNNHQLRIIGGKHRGRKLDVLDKPGLRPTADRVRETLFNWLQSDIIGSNVLDLFCGAGGLSFEACSRGAKHIDMVEIDKQVCEQLREQVAILNCPVKIFNQQAESFLSQTTNKYDLVFLDPPFSTDLLQATISHPDLSASLTNDALVYVEMAKADRVDVPDYWHLIKEKTTTTLCYRLYQMT